MPRRELGITSLRLNVCQANINQFVPYITSYASNAYQQAEKMRFWPLNLVVLIHASDLLHRLGALKWGEVTVVGGPGADKRSFELCNSSLSSVILPSCDLACIIVVPALHSLHQYTTSAMLISLSLAIGSQAPCDINRALRPSRNQC
jgi:hypothetical protein